MHTLTPTSIATASCMAEDMLRYGLINRAAGTKLQDVPLMAHVLGRFSSLQGMAA